MKMIRYTIKKAVKAVLYLMKLKNKKKKEKGMLIWKEKVLV